MKFKKYLFKPIYRFGINDQHPTIQYKVNIDNGLSDFYIFKDSSNKMSRILQYKDTGCMIISAERSEEYSDEENLNRTKQLEYDLKSLGLGYRPSIGGYIEEGKKPDEELSFIVPKPSNMEDKEFLNIALDLCKKYNQDTVLVILPSLENGKPVYLTKEGNVDMDFDNLRFKKEEDKFYTKIKKSTSEPFVFYKKDSLGNNFKFIKNNDLTIEDVSEYYDKYELENYHPGILKYKGFKDGFFEFNCDDRFKFTKYEVK